MLTVAGRDIANAQSSHVYRQEAEHRIANSLQVISAIVRDRARRGPGSDPRTFLLEIADRIETVGQLHRLLTESTSGAIDLTKYLREITNRLTGALAPEAASLSLDCPEEYSLPAKQALPLALIVAELVSNSLKYAHPAGLPTKINLSCRANGAGLAIAYEDDGVGFPDGFDLSEAGHTGMHLIGMLSAGLRGGHEWFSDPLGIRFTMSVPIE